MQLHPDIPVLIDALDRAELIKSVGQAAAVGQPPLVFGIHGDWGTGKTSLLHQIYYYLTGSCPQQTKAEVAAAKIDMNVPVETDDKRRHIRCVWFEAWRYQNEPVPVVALLHEMRAQLALDKRVVRRLQRAGSIAVRGALLSMEDLTKKIGLQASKFAQAGRQWEAEHLAAALPANTIRDYLEEAIRALLPNDRHSRVVVLIDDLDRCEPEAAYRLLEGFKLYLTLSNCVFILGMNQRIVEDAIGEHVPGDLEALKKERAGAYLEKLCQNIWRVPTMQQPKQYLLSLLPDTVYRRWLDAAIGEAHCLPPNPRRLKGLANLLIRFEHMLQARRGGPNEDQLTKTRLMLIVALVYQFHRDLYRRWEAYPELLERIRDWCMGEMRSDMGPGVPEAGEGEQMSVTPADSVEALFQPLQPVIRVIRDPSAQTPGAYREEPAFPDPEDTKVFWAQPLVIEVVRLAELQQFELAGEAFLPYLHGWGERREDV